MSRKFLAAVVICLLASCGRGELPSGNLVSGGSSSIVAASELADESAVRFRHVDAVNALRTSRGLNPLDYSQALNSAALTHARDMALQQRAWHFGSDRSNPQSRAARAGFGGKIIGENIAEAFDGDIDILQNWLNKPDAAALILNPEATSLGFGWFQEPTGKLWWVELFGAPGGIGTGLRF